MHSYLGKHVFANNTVYGRSEALSNFSCLLLALRYEAVVVWAHTPLLLRQHVCLGLRMHWETGVWKSKPISISESWGVAFCIQTCFNQVGTSWHTVWCTTKDRAWTRYDRPGQSHVAPNNCDPACASFLLLMTPRWSERLQFCKCCTLAVHCVTWPRLCGHSLQQNNSSTTTHSE